MNTLREAHTLASAYWDTKGGTTGPVMSMRAEKAVELGGLGWKRPVASLTATDATRVLTGLHKLALSSRSSYYAAFRRMLALAGVSTVGWPSAGHAPRRVREPMPREAAEGLRAWLETNHYPQTADLITLLLATGMRVDVEALSKSSLTFMPATQATLGAPLLKIVGKGGNERVIPLGCAEACALLRDTSRVRAMRKLSYSGHLKRWNKGAGLLGITTKLPTPHAIRHLYATEAYKRSGRNLHVVRELLGHADINTTARYIGVDMEELRNAAGA